MSAYDPTRFLNFVQLSDYTFVVNRGSKYQCSVNSVIRASSSKIYEDADRLSYSILIDDGDVLTNPLIMSPI